MTRIVFGYFAACLAVGLALWTPLTVASIASSVIDGPPSADYSHGSMLLILVVYALLTALATLMFTALPAVILIFIAERLKVRAWWAYVIGAALIGAMAYSLLPWGPLLVSGTPDFRGAAMFAALGAVAGLVYWWIAVRGRDRQPSPIV